MKICTFTYPDKKAINRRLKAAVERLVPTFRIVRAQRAQERARVARAAEPRSLHPKHEVKNSRDRGLSNVLKATFTS